MCHIADDYVVEVAVAEVRTYANEYDTDSENDFSDREDEDITLTTVSDPGGQFIALRDFMYYTYFGENQEKPWEGEGQFTPEIMYQNMTLPKCKRMITEKSNFQMLTSNK